MKRIVAVLATLAFAGAGCTGSTEHATDESPTSARLNAQGTASNGPAYSFFEYERVVPPFDPRTTARRSWPAGASGRFSELVTGLTEATTYRFRLCGGDQGRSPVCAQYRQFQTTGPAGKDSALNGWFTGTGAGAPSGNVSAQSEPDGRRPQGRLDFYGYDDAGVFYRFIGFVTCLAVEGNRAVVGAVGQAEFQGGGPERASTGLVRITDDDFETQANEDRVTWSLAPGSTPPSCAGVPPATGTVLFSNVVVTDTRP